MQGKLKPGDRVAWDTSQGETSGTVEKKLTSKTKVKGYVAKATRQDPQYLVRSGKSGKKAIHRPRELKKR